MKPLRSSAPAHSILSTAFRYTPAAQTDIRRTFAKARREMTARKAVVTPLKRKRA